MDIKYKQFSREELIQRIKELEYDNFALQEELINKTVGETSYATISSKEILHNRERAYETLLKTCDSLFLLRHNGECVDCIIKSNHWFLKNHQIIGKNVFEILPQETTSDLKVNFDEVVMNGGTSTQNYDLL